MPLLIKAGSGKSELPELFLHYYSLQLAGWFAADFFCNISGPGPGQIQVKHEWSHD